MEFGKDVGGAEFYTAGRDSGGNGVIRFGDYKDLRFIAEMLVHEALEAILVEDHRRFHCTDFELGNRGYHFLFDHDYFDSVGPKLLDAMLSSGFFRLVDGRPKKRMACGKGKKKGKGKGK